MTRKSRGRHEMDLYWSPEREIGIVRKLGISAFGRHQSCLHLMRINAFCGSLEFAKFRKNAWIMPLDCHDFRAMSRPQNIFCTFFWNILIINVTSRESGAASDFSFLFSGWFWRWKNDMSIQYMSRRNHKEKNRYWRNIWKTASMCFWIEGGLNQVFIATYNECDVQWIFTQKYKKCSKSRFLGDFFFFFQKGVK